MTAHNPLTAPTDRRPGRVSEWSLQPGETEIERLERYCSEMNRRDPRGLLWFVGQNDKLASVECRSRHAGEW
jgi:hypothetical protein